jgi:hypothetical protein
MTETETLEIDPKDLRLEAYGQRITQLVSQYEELDTERRIDITVLSYKNEKLNNRVEDLERELEEIKKSKKK